MIKLSLLVASVLLATSAASAESHLILECTGSVFKDMSMSETYRISVTDNNVLEVKGWYYSSLGLTMPMNSSTVKVSNNSRLFVQEKRKRLGITVESKTVDLDFENRRGKVSYYRAIEDLAKVRHIYLKDCRR